MSVSNDEVYNRQLALAHAIEFAREDYGTPEVLVETATTFLAFLNGDVDASSS